MKKKIETKDVISFIRKIIPKTFLGGPALASAAAFVLCLGVILWNLNSGWGSGERGDDLEAGKVADRDIVAEYSVTYEDVDATRLRREAQERQVPAVFLFSQPACDEVLNKWRQFELLVSSSPSPDDFKRGAGELLPGIDFGGALDGLYQSPERPEILRQAKAVLESLLNRGIYAIPRNGIGEFNLDTVELVRQTAGRIERERVPYSAVITGDKVKEVLQKKINSGAYPPDFVKIGSELLEPFVSETAFYSAEETVQQILETRAKTEPVLKYIERGKRIIKKGFIITDDEMAELEALNTSIPGNDGRNIAAQIIYLLLIFCLLYFYCSKGIMGRSLNNPEIYLVCVLSGIYIAGTILLKDFSFGSGAVVISLLVPTALIIMLPSILISFRLALFLAMALPLEALISGAYDTPSYLFALVSGVVASFTLKGAQKRMDLIKAGLIVALANCVAMTAILLSRRLPAGTYPALLFWSAFNGLGSGMLVLGFLPPLEHALNAATAFRLRELADLNAPILRRLFISAPGTYSHSIMVANLAEAACQDIGANALLARVGAYYHDLGKMENPDYFVENQTDHNKHDDIAPRLSATIIRSHVKLGLEKARALGLPREVMDIIVEHHGNSVITWFYNKAKKQEGRVNMEDFSYPGTPPRSRESAVVMLADTTEAAVRTLDKPTVARLEKFIQELFNAKVEFGQLSRAELTFRDLETIKNAFVRVLVGYYHSRIEYPKEEK
jgi:putative nucleotidyltransferase with HDIG domain